MVFWGHRKSSALQMLLLTKYPQCQVKMPQMELTVISEKELALIFSRVTSHRTNETERINGGIACDNICEKDHAYSQSQVDGKVCTS